MGWHSSCYIRVMAEQDTCVVPVEKWLIENFSVESIAVIKGTGMWKHGSVSKRYTLLATQEQMDALVAAQPETPIPLT